MLKLLYQAQGILDPPHCTFIMIIIKPNIYKCLFGPNLSLEQKQISTSVVTEMLLLLGKVASSTLKQELGCSLQ